MRLARNFFCNAQEKSLIMDTLKLNPILGGVMQFCITLDIFAGKSGKNELLVPVMVLLLLSIYFTYSAKIS